MVRFLACALMLVTSAASAQSFETRYAAIGSTVMLHLANTPFPAAARDSGHTYGARFFPAALHYRDSSVGVFIPKGFRADRPVDIAVHIHGWGNNVDSVFAQFRIAEQLVASGRNALLVVPQGPKNAPDSFGGKLEEPGRFKAFMQELVDSLVRRGVLTGHEVRSVVLSGHSGAYRMISFILAQGGLNDKIREVYLFDALYGQVEKYFTWVRSGAGRFVCIYADSGGTRETTETFMKQLEDSSVAIVRREEAPLPNVPSPLVTDNDLRTKRVVFIHSDLTHSGVIMDREQYKRFLSTGQMEKW